MIMLLWDFALLECPMNKITTLVLYININKVYNVYRKS